jgi:hypothetical protein
MRKGVLVRFLYLDRPARTLVNHATRLESEGGADSWDRPRLKHIDQARDKIGAEAFLRVRTVVNVSTQCSNKSISTGRMIISKQVRRSMYLV